MPEGGLTRAGARNTTSARPGHLRRSPAPPEPRSGRFPTAVSANRRFKGNPSCPIEQRKDVLRQVLDEARCERIIYVDHMVGYRRQLLEGRAPGAEGVVSKRRGSLYRGGRSSEDD